MVYKNVNINSSQFTYIYYKWNEKKSFVIKTVKFNWKIYVI